jgi:hypothetical protein
MHRSKMKKKLITRLLQKALEVKFGHFSTPIYVVHIFFNLTKNENYESFLKYLHVLHVQ